MKTCSICSTRHELWQGHVFGTKPAVVNTAVAPVNTDPESVNTGIAVVNTGSSVNADRHSPGYMREYMKVWRAVRAGRAEWVK